LSLCLSHGLRPSELSVLNVNHWNGKRLTVHRSKGQNVSEVPLSREAKQHLEAYLEWRRKIGEVFTPLPDSPMFLSQDPKYRGERLGYKGLYKMVKKLGAIASVEGSDRTASGMILARALLVRFRPVVWQGVDGD
jgi:integrase/recombinase XerD